MKLHLPKSLFLAVLAACATMMPSVHAASQTFTGTGTTNRDINVSNSSAEDVITFQMGDSGSNNYFAAGEKVSNAQILIEDDDPTDDVLQGLILNNGYSSTHAIMTGTVTGDGAIKKSAAGTDVKVTFEGDVTGYTGNIYMHAASNGPRFVLTFGGRGDTGVAAATTTETKGAAGTGNVEFKDNESTLQFNYSAAENPVYITNEITDINGNNKSNSNLTLKGGADYILTKGVTVDKITLSAGSATFKGNATIFSSITNAGTVTFNENLTFGADTLVSGAGTTNVNNMTLNAGVTLTTQGALAVTGTITAGDNSKWKLDGTAGSFTQQLTAPNVGNLKSLEVGSGVVLDVTTTDMVGFNPGNISGAGTVEVSLTNAHSNTLNLGTNFTGETYVRVGCFTLTNAKVGNTIRLGNDVEGQTTANTQFGANIVLEGNAGVHANSGNSITYNGTVTGIVRDGVTQGVFKSKGSSSHTFNNTVNLAGFDTEAGAGVTFNGQLTLGYLTADHESATVKVNNDATIGTVTQDKATLTFGGEDVTVTISEKLHSKRGTLNIGSSEGGTVFVSAARLEAGDSNNATFNTTLNIYNGSTLKITGSTDSSDYKTTSLVISEWKGGSTLNVEGSLLAQNATLMLGNSKDDSNNPYDTIIKVGATGTIAVKGIKNSKEGQSLGTLKLTILDGGKLILGANGFSTPKAVEAKIGAATIGISADSVTIAEAMILTSADGAIFDTQKYAFATDGNSIAQTEAGGTLTVSGVLSGVGGVVKAGAGNLVFTCDHTYTGTTDIQEGSLVLNLGSNGIYTLDNDVTGDGTLQVNAGTTVKTEGHNVQSALYLNGGSLMVTAAGSADDAMLPTSSSVVVSDNASITFTKALSTSSDLTITGGAGSAVTLSGEQNTIKGALTITEGTGLTLDADSALTVNSPIQNNGNLDIQGTVNWNLASTKGLTVTYSEEERSKTENGLRAGVIKGLITGNGKLENRGDKAVTVNDKTGTLATGTGEVTANVVYYVMSPAENADDGYRYSMFGEYDNSSDVVYVGVHTYPGPIADADANNALGFYVGKNGILGIIGDSNTMSSGEILSQTQGEGTIILRAPGADNETDENGMRENLYVTVGSETQFAGNLSIATQLLKSSAEAETKSVYLHLEDKADISSFSSIEMGNGTHILLDGIIKKSESKKGHINNLTNSGSGFTYLYINQGANKELVLGGDTTLRTYAHIPATDENEGYEQGSYMRLVFNQNAQVIIENLTTGGDTRENMYWNTLEITSAYETLYANDKVVNGIVNIESFDYRGFIYLSAGTEGSILANLNLKAGQTLYDDQYSRDTTAVGDKGLIIKGEGTYVLSEGNSILSNFGVLSTEFTEDGARIWQGTVEVNNLDATIDAIQGIEIADYGNENSTIHFKGFTGYLKDSTTAVEIKPDLILENSGAMNAYEITSGDTGQVQTYTGDISGTGDFVVSAAENMTFNLQGNLSEWKDGAELKVTAGTQAVNFSDAATVINADVLATNGATMNADISNTKSSVTVNGKVKADGGTLNLSVNTAQGTTFTNEVNVTKISVGADSNAKLKAASSAGNVSIGSYGGEDTVATLKNGLTIEENTVGHGLIEYAKISHIQKAGTIELVEVTATNLYLYGGKPVQFHSTDSSNQFTFDKQISYGSERVNEVVFTSEIFSGMILSKDGAQLTLTVDNAVVWGDAVQPDWTNVTIELKGFTIEQLGTAGDWDWKSYGLSFIVNEASEATSEAAGGLGTVTDLLNDKYEFVVYEQNAYGLTIRMYNTPEPTTATLSMLALAALAARRRRASR